MEKLAEKEAAKVKAGQVKFATAILSKISGPKVSLRAIMDNPLASQLPETIANACNRALKEMTSIDDKATAVVNDGGGECPVSELTALNSLVTESKRQGLLAKSILDTVAKS